MSRPTVTTLPPHHPMEGLLRDAHARAVEIYNACYDDGLYRRAIASKRAALISQLIDDALALCGSPYYRVSRHHWSEPARLFLMRFAVR